MSTPTPTPAPSPESSNEFNLTPELIAKLVEIEMLLMASLLIQVLLTFVAPLRKRKASGFLTVFLWLLYVSATSSSVFVVGSIARIMISEDHSSTMFCFLMIYASFSLLHIGSPYSITSLSLEDNELWLRRAWKLVAQATIIFYSFSSYCIKYFKKSNFYPLGPWLLTIAALMFTNGYIKYIERICALYFSSKYGIRAFHNREALLKTCETKDDNSCSGDDEDIHANEFEFVKHAYFLYDKFTCQLADDVLSLTDDLDSRSRLLFLHRPVNIGLRIIEAQLNLIYDTFHTKVILMFRKQAFLRIIACFIFLITSSLLVVLPYYRCATGFECTIYREKGFSRAAEEYLLISIIPVLFVGAILVDIASLIGFFFSDWCIIMVVKQLNEKPSRVKKWFLLVLEKLLRRRSTTSKRWCEKCSCYNLLDCSLKRTYLNKLLSLLHLKRSKDFLIDWLYVKRQRITRPCLLFVFQELQQKAKLAFEDKQAVKQVCSARGNLVFEDSPHYLNVSTSLQPWTVDVNYSQSLLTWHLATDICYWADSSCNDSGDNSFGVDYRALSKQLSDYMAYILLRQPDMVPQLVRKSHLRFKATKKDIICAYPSLSSSSKKHLPDFCTKLLQQQPEASGGVPLSVLQESRSLAQKLNDIDREKKWETICKVWVEMLCYAAVRSMPRYNFVRLSKGGELITLVWLYMTQLGFLPSKLSD